MKPQHIATIGVAGVFALAATSAITIAEYRLMDAGRDAVTAFFLPGQNDFSIVDGSRSSYVASDFERTSRTDGTQLVSELKSEIAGCPDKAPEVVITATQQPSPKSETKRVFLNRRTSSTPRVANLVRRDVTAPQAVPESNSMRLASDLPEAPTAAEVPPTMVFHVGEAAMLRASTQLRQMETTLKTKAFLANLRAFQAEHPGTFQITVDEAAKMPKVRVIVDTPEFDSDETITSE